MDQAKWLDRMDLEHDNIRASLRYLIDTSDAPTGLRAAARIWRFWHFRGYLAEGRRWIEELLALPSAADDASALAPALSAVGGLAYWQNDFAAADRYYRQSLDLYRDLDDPKGMADVFHSLGYVAAANDDLEAAFRFYAQSRDISHEIGDRRGEAWARLGLGVVSALTPGQPGAIEEANAALEYFRTTHDKWAVGNALSLVAQVARQRDDTETARKYATEAVELFAELGDVSGIVGILDDLSVLASRLGEHKVALTLYSAAAHLKENVGGGPPAAIVRIPDPRPEASKILPADEFDEAWSRGSRMTLEEATEYLLDTLRTGLASRGTSPS
jgi:tetratricopeptide (TPR) repeat protein